MVNHLEVANNITNNVTSIMIWNIQEVELDQDKWVTTTTNYLLDMVLQEAVEIEEMNLMSLENLKRDNLIIEESNSNNSKSIIHMLVIEEEVDSIMKKIELKEEAMVAEEISEAEESLENIEVVENSEVEAILEEMVIGE